MQKREDGKIIPVNKNNLHSEKEKIKTKATHNKTNTAHNQQRQSYGLTDVTFSGDLNMIKYHHQLFFCILIPVCFLTCPHFPWLPKRKTSNTKPYLKVRILTVWRYFVNAMHQLVELQVN